jgi:hypothetical protein
LSKSFFLVKFERICAFSALIIFHSQAKNCEPISHSSHYTRNESLNSIVLLLQIVCWLPNTYSSLPCQLLSDLLGVNFVVFHLNMNDDTSRIMTAAHFRRHFINADSCLAVLSIGWHTHTDQWFFALITVSHTVLSEKLEYRSPMILINFMNGEGMSQCHSSIIYHYYKR